MKKVETIRQKRQNTHIMQRLRVGTEIEREKNIKQVQRNLSLIRSPAAGLKERKKLEEAMEEGDESMVSELADEVDITEVQRNISITKSPVIKEPKKKGKAKQRVQESDQEMEAEEN